MSVAQQEIPNIVYRPEAYGSPRYETLIASLGDNPSCGSLVYDRSVSGGCWDLEGLDVEEDVQGIGIGKALLQSFAKRIGAGQPVRAVIIHDDTVGMLAEKYKEAGAEGRYSVPEEELTELPIVRILNSGNIDVKVITVAPNPLDSRYSPFDIELWGKTR